MTLSDWHWTLLILIDFNDWLILLIDWHWTLLILIDLILIDWHWTLLKLIDWHWRPSILMDWFVRSNFSAWLYRPLDITDPGSRLHFWKFPWLAPGLSSFGKLLHKIIRFSWKWWNYQIFFLQNEDNWPNGFDRGLFKEESEWITIT